MKRILAAFLTLAMVLNIAPVGALAASDSDAASIQAVAETEESPSSALDEETARAIASDPFLQGADSAPEEQQQQAEVDTSDVSMTATNSFGQLLVNGMEQATDNSENRVIKVEVNGDEAKVRYVAKESADLVVALYEDTDTERMITSGTVRVSAMTENSGYAETTVTLGMTAPEYFIIKAYLLREEDHAPLSKAYKSDENRKAIVDLDSASADDFEPERVVNLDDDPDTNFGVVRSDVKLFRADGLEQENGGETNRIALEDNENLIYRIENADDAFLSIQPGDTFVYEYAKGELMVARAKSVEVDRANRMITIYGDETLSLGDAFDAMKMDGDGTTDDAEIDESTGDGSVRYLGKFQGESLDVANDIDFNVKTEYSQVFEISTDDFKDEDKKDDGPGWSGSVSGSVKGTISLKAGINIKLRVANGEEMFSLVLPLTEGFSFTATGTLEADFNMPKINIPTGTPIKVGFEPKVVIRASAELSINASSTQQVGFRWEKGKGATDLSTDPVTSANFKLKGSLYVGIDLGPKVGVEAGDLSILKLKLKAEGGVELSAEETMGEQGSGKDEIHGCLVCYTGTLSFKLTTGISLQLLFYKPGISFTPVSKTFGTVYASQDLGKYGLGECPNKKYRLTIQTNSAHAGVSLEIYKVSECVKTSTLDADGNCTVYLPKGDYTLIFSDKSTQIVRSVSLSEARTMKVKLEEGTDPDNPDPDNPDKPGTSEPTTPEDGRWTLKNGVFTLVQNVFDYLDTSRGPWYDSRLDIREIVTEPEVNAIGRYTFADCTNLTTVTFKGRLAWVDDNAFKNCPAITDVYYAETMRDWAAMDKGKGNECLTNAKIHCSDGTIAASGTCGKRLTWVLDEEGNLQISGTGEMTADPDWPKEKIVHVEIRNGMTRIYAEAFKDCENLTDISIPNSVTTIWPSAFEGCVNLKEIVLPDNMKSFGGSLFKNCTSLEKVTLPSKLTEIPAEAFLGCEKLKDIEIPENVTEIGDHAFKDCTSLTKLSVPEKTEQIGIGAFRGCTNLEEVLIPYGVTSIAHFAFAECPKLTKIVLPDSVTDLGGGVFDDCTNLQSAKLPNGLTTIPDSLFAGCGKLENIAIPASVASIGDRAFLRCESLKKLELPKNLYKIGESAFCGCVKLNAIELPASLKNIGGWVFSGCNQLAQITIPAGVQSIGTATFQQCENLRKVSLPDTIQTIGEYAFFECGNLREIVLPNSVISIGEYAFWECNELKEVTYRGTAAQWKTIDIVDQGNWPIDSATIHCTDGDIVPDSENSISTGTATPTTGNKFAATFSGAEAGREYVVIVSRSGSDPLNADNLLYINQITAQADGELAVPFITAADASEVKYTVACTRDDAEPDQPVDPGKPDDKPASGGDGGGSMAIVLVGGVVLVAAVAGVVLMMPVDVQGTVKLANQPVANATVQVLQGDNVAAQTTTDANGWFAVKVRRGSYTLRVLWTDAEGNPVTRTQDFKAPDTSLSIAA